MFTLIYAGGKILQGAKLCLHAVAITLIVYSSKKETHEVILVDTKANNIKEL